MVITKLIFTFATFLREVEKLNFAGQYEVLFTGLKPGEYFFDFQIGRTFFENSESDGIKDGEVRVRVRMDREERMMDLHFHIEGKVNVPCDRCNEPMDIEIAGEERLIIKLGDRYFEESEDVQIIPETDNKIDLGPFIYEYIYLLLPARRVHPDDESGNSTCNPEVLRRLKELSENHVPDPRWEVLNKLKNHQS
ncbi:MAG: DUF177 domain-containing protein [Bacteroidales bacterium]|nr:DUF177 domain-containing protein [Bacteroidales bacterium]